MLLQLPVFFLMYRAFSSSEVGGAANELLGHRLFAAPLGSRWTDALGEGGLFGAQGLVFLGLFAAVGVVAAWSAVRGRRAAAPMVAPAAAPLVAAAGGARAARGGGKAGSGAGGAASGRAKATSGRAKAGTGASKGASKGAGGAGKGVSGGAKGAAGVGALSAEQQAVMRKLGGVLPLLSFGTLITAAVVPLAAGLYLVTTTAWSVAERAWLQYRKERAAREDEEAGAARSSL